MDLHLYNGKIFIYAERLNIYCRLITCFVGEVPLSASLVAKLFFDNIVRIFGVPTEVISDTDPSFTASFW